MTSSSFKRLIDVFQFQLKNYPKKDALAAKENPRGENFKDQWRTYSTQDCITKSNKISAALINAGIEPGDKIAIISENRPEWIFSDIGIMQIKAINTPLYPTLSTDEFEFIFNHAEIKIVFVSTRELYEKIAAIRKNCPALQLIVTYDNLELNEDSSIFFKDFLKIDEKPYLQKISELKNTIGEEDVATIIYTSGTTGTPKGVILSHKNIVSNVVACTPLLPVDYHHRALSFLPLNHVFERMLTYLYLSAGISVYYAESMETIGDNLREVKPQIFSAVPRLLEKVYEKIMAKGSELTGIKRKLFYFSIRLGENYDYSGKSWWYKTKLKLANKLVFKKWREALGGNVKAVVSGSAALSPRLNRIFTAGGIDIMEGYGLTETSPVIAVNRIEFENRCFGTVGPLIDGVEVQIAEDGEILCKGPNIMKGYYKNDEETEKMFTRDGWLKTGDIGSFVDNKFLKILDRKNSMFKTSGGKWVAPQPLEEKFQRSPFINQIMIVGKGKKFVSALIVPEFEKIRKWAKTEGLKTQTNKGLVENEEVISLFHDIVEEINADLGQVDQVKKFTLLPDEWTITREELTPTLKLKRRIILSRYEEEIEGMYKA